MDLPLVLTINPGSTSTKIAVFRGNQQTFLKNIKHTAEELASFEKITDQYEFRKTLILEELKAADIILEDIKVIVGRGGVIKPCKSGVYEVNGRMKDDLRDGEMGQHASNLGGLIADDLAKSIPGTKAYIADPVVVDEFEDIARISGHPLLPRRSLFHALNSKAIARIHANSISKSYNELNLIVAHLGGGITVSAHCKGRVIDSNQGLDGDGPFSPERSGTLPVGDLVRLCFSGKYPMDEILKMITGNGGYMAYFGTNDAYEIEQRAEAGDQEAKLIHDAMAYQVAKEIGAMSTVLKGGVDGILLTGGMAYGKAFVEQIRERVEHIAQVFAYPGEDEMKALATNGLMVITGQVTPLQYEY